MATPAQAASTKAWLDTFYAANDTLNPSVFVPQFYHPDSQLHVPGGPSLTGHEQILAFYNQQVSLVSSMKHTIRHFDVLSDRVYVESEVEYTVAADPEKRAITVNALAVVGKRLDEDKLRSFKVFMDPKPLVGRLEEVLAAAAAAAGTETGKGE
ncbi:hypothetical protein BO70DRAFT_425882 [Aspergillus heteromorphus CBS 117.55]|uniref:SnoaL-like domain-containing protein n=1 Tax=Aspergillus heteromorphus CBS 117.55 TaxID=1448321 RepID=A0A317WX46_9EURO|nr:uncharacterized protein BO70DRAFT_425882 [Aspergillus heteromorphus CBS 117.55]PWY90959.1 hypothetical protein BO70DRAFT_425882 [Aspergillus heteromorphus CBS 117.55]